MGRKRHRPEIVAEIYDHASSEFYDHHAKRDDIDFYVGAAIESGGPVLEIGCGTGRLLIPTARAGVRITGLDRSKEMLDICGRKLEEEPAEIRDRVEVVQADMRDFDLASEFSLVTIPFGPFNYLVSPKDHVRCLECVHRNLRPGGALLMDLWYPDLRKLWASEKGAEIVRGDAPFAMPDGRSVLWGIRHASVDFNRQVIHEEMYYDVRHPDGREVRMLYPASMRYFFRFEVEHLLARVEFQVEAVYADFEKSPFGSKYPSEMVFMARKRGGS